MQPTLFLAVAEGASADDPINREDANAYVLQ